MLDIAAKIISDAQKIAAMKLRDHFSACRTFARGIDGDGKYQNGGLDDYKRQTVRMRTFQFGRSPGSTEASSAGSAGASRCFRLATRDLRRKRIQLHLK
jgi:hypothetical protein